MPKYMLKSALVATLKSRGIVKADDTMTLRLPHRGNGEVETAFEVTFNVLTEAIETDNRIAMNAIEQKHGPKIKVGNPLDWWAGDPAVAWFEELPGGDPTPSQIVHTHGNEIITRADRRLTKYWSRATDNPLPGTWDKGDTAVHLGNAVAHRATWWD